MPKVRVTGVEMNASIECVAKPPLIELALDPEIIHLEVHFPPA